MNFIKICMECGIKRYFWLGKADTDKDLCESCYHDLKSHVRDTANSGNESAENFSSEGEKDARVKRYPDS